jgi:hypothetical protein
LAGEFSALELDDFDGVCAGSGIGGDGLVVEELDGQALIIASSDLDGGVGLEVFLIGGVVSRAGLNG